VSDMQYLDRLLTSLSIEEDYSSTGHSMNAKNLHKYLSKVFYKRRSDFNPLWNQVLVAGLDDESKPFLASADLLGTTFSAPSLATGFGAHLAQPLLRKIAGDEAAAEKLTEAEAVAAVKESMKVLFYRDARSMDKYSIAVVTKEGINLKEDEKLENQSWALYVFLSQISPFACTMLTFNSAPTGSSDTERKQCRWSYEVSSSGCGVWVEAELGSAGCMPNREIFHCNIRSMIQMVHCRLWEPRQEANGKVRATIIPNLVPVPR